MSGAVVTRGIVACDWQATSAVKAATNRRKVKILDQFFIVGDIILDSQFCVFERRTFPIIVISKWAR